jgi:hypothetical protein
VNVALPSFQRDLHQQTHEVIPVVPTVLASSLVIPLPDSRKMLTNPVDDT